MAYDSVETWRLYSAEASVRLDGERFADHDAARTYLTEIQRSRWWRWNVRDDVLIVLDGLGNDVDGQVNSFCRPNDDPPTSWTISMHPQQLDAYHLLHEVAHCIAPRIRQARPGAIGSPLEEIEYHGREFAGVRLALTEQFAGAEVAAELVTAFEHFKSPVMPWADVLVALEESRVAEAQYARAKAADPYGMRSLRRAGSHHSRADLGPVLNVARFMARIGENRRRPTQAQVADLVSTVIPCSARDVSTIERLQGPPSTKRRYQVALCLAVLFNLDPVKAQFQLGLDREEWDIPLEQLALINSDWVEVVQELDQLVRGRPPRWFAHP